MRTLRDEIECSLWDDDRIPLPRRPLPMAEPIDSPRDRSGAEAVIHELRNGAELEEGQIAARLLKSAEYIERLLLVLRLAGRVVRLRGDGHRKPRWKAVPWNSEAWEGEK